MRLVKGLHPTRLPRLGLCVATIVVTGVAGDGGHAQATVSVESLLASAADSLDAYSREFSAVVSEEQYDQTATMGVSKDFRGLRSDVMLINGGDAGWLSFRDVFEVDRKPVRDRDERLLLLFLHPSDGAIQQANKILNEGARFNLGRVNRTINVPTQALSYLRRENQPRSAFELRGEATVNGIRTRVLRFTEKALPRLIHTSNDAPAKGQFWVDSVSGRVARTELVVDSDVHAAITVTYTAQPKLGGLWVPTKMEEHYATGIERIDSFATYSNFRRFTVDVTTKIIK